MKGFLKVVLPLILVGSLVSGKEDNGAFVGLELGFGELQLGYGKEKSKSSAIAVGGKVGYKHFFLDWVGLRGYVGANYAENASKQSGGSEGGKNIQGDIVYTANIDALFNFYSSESFNAGAFVGIGLGGEHFELNIDGYKYKADGFYADAKVGLRVNAAKNHDVEFIAKIPFTKIKYNKYLKINQNYQILLGYSYAF